MSKICYRCKKERPLDHFISKTCLICKKQIKKNEQKMAYNNDSLFKKKRQKKIW